MAGSSMKDIKLRIKSVESTMQITKAMQLVATSKLRRAKERMENSRPYASISRQALLAAVRRCADADVPYLTARPVRRRLYIVIAGERGLAGGYNANVFKAVAAHCGDIPFCVLPLGRKAIEKYHRMGNELLTEEYARIENLPVSRCYHLARKIAEGYLGEKYDDVWMVYTDFRSMMSQEVQMEQLLPIPRLQPGEGPASDTLYEVEAAETLERFVPDFLAGRLYSALCDAFVSEVSARRMAMDSATKNADAMISDLTLRYNRARQGAITQEITEIVAGAEH
ncbi:MAG: ATP synthase F1 subunit gamma [Clostridia bacterium]|nr:ATP synthase F1 subunit gamma [Clostridia bacterium]